MKSSSSERFQKRKNATTKKNRSSETHYFEKKILNLHFLHKCKHSFFFAPCFFPPLTRSLWVFCSKNPPGGSCNQSSQRQGRHWAKRCLEERSKMAETNFEGMNHSKGNPTYPWSIPQTSPNPQMKGIPS